MGLDVAVAPGFAGRDEGQPGSFSGPVGRDLAGELGAVVGSQHRRSDTAFGADVVEFVTEPGCGDASFDEAGE